MSISTLLLACSVSMSVSIWQLACSHKHMLMSMLHWRQLILCWCWRGRGLGCASDWQTGREWKWAGRRRGRGQHPRWNRGQSRSALSAPSQPAPQQAGSTPETPVAPPTPRCPHPALPLPPPTRSSAWPLRLPCRCHSPWASSPPPLTLLPSPDFVLAPPPAPTADCSPQTPAGVGAQRKGEELH